MHSSLAIANEFIRRSLAAPEIELTQMKLQKLVYFAHGWNLVASDGDPLVEDEVQAWDYGPVFPKLYSATRRFGREPIRDLLRWGEDTPFPDDDDGPAFEPLEESEREVIDFVWDTYGDFQAYQLSALTHEEHSPWTRVFDGGRNRPIPNRRIQDYFANFLGTE